MRRWRSTGAASLLFGRHAGSALEVARHRRIAIGSGLTQSCVRQRIDLAELLTDAARADQTLRSERIAKLLLLLWQAVIGERRVQKLILRTHRQQRVLPR